MSLHLQARRPGPETILLESPKTDRTIRTLALNSLAGDGRLAALSIVMMCVANQSQFLYIEIKIKRNS